MALIANTRGCEMLLRSEQRQIHLYRFGKNSIQK
jgi:hypothetical protein